MAPEWYFTVKWIHIVSATLHFGTGLGTAFHFWFTCRAGLPANYAAIVVRDQEAIREGLGTRVTDVVPRIAGRAAIPFSAYAAHAAPAFATP